MAVGDPWHHGGERVVRIDGARISLFEAGRRGGPALLLLHGLGGCWQNWYANIAPLAAAGHHLIVPDLPGFGRSDPAPGSVSISAYADTIAALCDRLEHGRVVVVGNSMGGFIAAELALRDPERVAGLVLVSPAGMCARELWRGRALPIARTPVPLVMPFLFRATAQLADVVAAVPALRTVLLREIFANPGGVDPDSLRHSLRGSGRPHGYAGALRAILSYDLQDALTGVTAPALVIHGEDDRLVPLEHARRFHRALGGSRLEVWPGVGHAPMLEAPARFNECLADFVAGLAAPGHPARALPAIAA
jgi:pimeloyl-ACP methyl ester carboxylesterase